MNTDNLIKGLASNGEAVKPVLPPLVQLAGWFAMATLYVGVGALLIGIRADAAEELMKPEFALQFLLPFFLSLASAASAFALGIPSRKEAWISLAALSVLTVCATFLGYMITSAHEAHAGTGIRCVRNVAILSLPPTLLLCFILKRAAPLPLKMAGMLALLGSSALACAATRFICPNEDALHFFAWHFLPVLFIGALGLGLGAGLFGKNHPGDLKK